MPIGLETCFDKLHAELGKAMLLSMPLKDLNTEADFVEHK
jgi:hypothetical protein